MAKGYWKGTCALFLFAEIQDCWWDSLEEGRSNYVFYYYLRGKDKVKSANFIHLERIKDLINTYTEWLDAQDILEHVRRARRVEELRKELDNPLYSDLG